MANQQKNIAQSNVNSQALQEEKAVEVLYQKMGDRWFAFSVIGEEVFVGSISQEEIDALEAGAQGQKTHTRTGQA